MQRLWKVKVMAAAGSFALAALASMGVNAAPITDDLVIIDGDKQFSNFTCAALGTANCANVSVTASTNPTLNGIRIQTGLVAFNGNSGDLLITYDVAVLTTSYQISQINMTFNGAKLGDAFGQVTETAFDGPLIVGQINVSTPGDLQDPAYEMDSDIPLSGTYDSLHIVKDIQVFAAGDCPTCNIAISFIDQHFEQVPTVPEPATLGLLGLGLLGLGAVARRRARA